MTTITAEKSRRVMPARSSRFWHDRRGGMLIESGSRSSGGIRMRIKHLLLALGIGVLPLAAPVAAHHSFAAEFDAKQKVSLTGVVTKVEWTNPHVWFWVNVKDPATGEVVNWGAEMGSPNALQRTGWSHNTLKVGMVVSFAGSRALNGSHRVNTNNVTVDGKRLGAASSQGVTP
jgi:hypothetical protein